MKNNELKKFAIKNCTSYYFGDLIKLEDFDLNDILIDEKSDEKNLICDISYITLTGLKPLRSRFDKINEIMKIYDGTRYLTLFGAKTYDAIYDKIRYLTSLKSCITFIFSHYFAKTKIDSYDFLTI